MRRDVGLAAGETYHVFNRGAHKWDIFRQEGDYERFLLLLFLANSSSPLDMRTLAGKYKGRSFVEAYTGEVIEQGLVDILAYCLMPNHFHLVLRQSTDDGIATFMRKAITAYSMYFNGKYEHSGALFQGRFKSRHIDTEAYFRWIFSYVHLNPVTLCEPGWESTGEVGNFEKVRQFIREYPYSSYYDYQVGLRPETALLTKNDVPDFLRKRDDLADLLGTFTKDGPL